VILRDSERPESMLCGLGRLSRWGGRVLRLVVAGGVDVEFAYEFAGGGVDDVDAEIMCEQEDVDSDLGSTMPMWRSGEVAKFAGDAQGDGSTHWTWPRKLHASAHTGDPGPISF
jgi:hypothetical protein